MSPVAADFTSAESGTTAELDVVPGMAAGDVLCGAEVPAGPDEPDEPQPAPDAARNAAASRVLERRAIRASSEPDLKSS